MNTGILIINILLLIGEIILGCILLFGKSYLQKKGKNTADKEDSQEIAMLKKIGEDIATKKDIGDITQEIKSVESKFINETEKLKAELNLLTNIKTGLISEKRNAIIDLHVSLNKWIQTAIYSIGTDLSDNNSIFKSIETIIDLYNNLLIKETMFKIYIEDFDLKSSFSSIVSSGLECMELRKNLCFALIEINYEIQPLQSVNDNLEIKKTRNKKDEVLRKYYAEREIIASDLFKKMADFENQCRIYIHSYNDN